MYKIVELHYPANIVLQPDTARAASPSSTPVILMATGAPSHTSPYHTIPYHTIPYHARRYTGMRASIGLTAVLRVRPGDRTL